MNKEFIPYQQALTLKELGFNLECGYLYNSTDDNPYPYPCDVIGLSQDWNTLYRKDTNNHLLSAPLYQQAFRWFREKCQLHSTITSISQESWQWHIQKPGQQLGKLYNEGFSSYEEAELECLNKLIKIAKNNF
jgi:hypothetical protein